MTPADQQREAQDVETIIRDLPTYAESSLNALRRLRERKDALATRLAEVEAERDEERRTTARAMLDLVAECDRRKAEVEAALQEGQAIYDKFETAKPGGILRGNNTRGAVQMELDRWCYRTFGEPT